MKDGSLKLALFHMILASFFFASTGAIARMMKDDYSSVQLVLFRNIIGIGFVLYWIWKRPVVQRGGRLWLLLFRGFIGTMALYSFFYGVTTIGLPEAITYQQSYPIFLAGFTVLFLGQKINTKIWVALIIGFTGLCLIFVPKMNNSLFEMKSHIIGLSNLVLTAMAYLSIRGLSGYYDSRIIVLTFMSCGIVFPLLSMVAGHYYYTSDWDFLLTDFVVPRSSHFLVIGVFGIAALLGQHFLTKAFSNKNTGVIGAMGYSNIVFSILFGILIGDKLPDAVTMTGISLIIVSGVVVAIGIGH